VRQNGPYKLYPARSVGVQGAGRKPDGMKRFLAISALTAAMVLTPAVASAKPLLESLIDVRLDRGGGKDDGGKGRGRGRGHDDRSDDSLSSGWRQQQDEARDAVRQGRHVPLGQVIAQIDRRTPGRILDSGIEYQGNRAVYRVRWVTDDGRRIDYLVDAQTGAIIGAR